MSAHPATILHQVNLAEFVKTYSDQICVSVISVKHIKNMYLIYICKAH